MSLLAQLIARGIDKDDDDVVVFRPSRKFTAADVQRIAERGASEFRAAAMNVLSCYELEGEFGLYATLGNYVQTKNPMTAEIAEAVSEGDELALIQAFQRAMEYAFVHLCEKGALDRIQISENWTPEATVEYARLRRSVATTKAPNAAPAAAPVPAVTVPVVPAETPVEVCAREWKSLSGDQFRIKYLNNRNNRPIYEQALSEGII
jgi:hypothetical protein